MNTLERKSFGRSETIPKNRELRKAELEKLKREEARLDAVEKRTAEVTKLILNAIKNIFFLSS